MQTISGILYLPTFSDSKARDFYPGSARIFKNVMTTVYPKISKDFRRCLKISKDVPNNSEVLKKIIMLYTDLQKSEILGKAPSFTHFRWTFHFLHWFELHIFVCQLRL